MAYIDHRCACGHPATQHKNPGATPSRCLIEGCRTPCSTQPQPPTLIPTWDLQRRPVTEIRKPGSRAPFSVGTLCDCQACQALYAQLTGSGG